MQSEHSTTTNKTPHEVLLPAEPAHTKLSFIPNKCRLALQHTDETTPRTHPISENSSVHDWSRGLLLRQNRLSFPTRAVLPDNGRRDDTVPTPPPFPKTLQQMTVLAISSYFHFFRVFINNFLEGARSPVPPPCTPMTKAFAQTTRVGCTTNASYSRRESFERRFSCEETVCRPHPTPQVFQTDILA